MEHSDDKIDMPGEAEVDNIAEHGEKSSAPDADTAQSERGVSGAEILSETERTISIAVKTVAVALSVIAMLVVILAVGLPLQAMRIFNSLGNSARAIDFGDRYLERRLRSADLLALDEYGNYIDLMRSSEVSDDEFEEAVFVCTNLSYGLMEQGYASGDVRTGKYYAARTEKYTRLYLSMFNAQARFDAKSNTAMGAMPSAAFRPAVYDYGNTVRDMNFRARAYLDETGCMAGNNRSADAGYMNTRELVMRTATGTSPTDPDDRYSVMSVVDNFVSYVNQLCEYLSVEYARIGVETDLYKKIDVFEYNGGQIPNLPIVSEPYISSNYKNMFGGTEFGLLLKRSDYDDTIAFTPVYESLKHFPYYAQLAVDFVPDDRAGNREDEQLHQLYWLQSLDNAAWSLLYFEWLLQYNAETFGGDGMALIRENQGLCQSYRFVTVKNEDGADSVKQIINIYEQKMKEYLSL